MTIRQRPSTERLADSRANAAAPRSLGAAGAWRQGAASRYVWRSAGRHSGGGVYIALLLTWTAAAHVLLFAGDRAVSVERTLAAIYLPRAVMADRARLARGTYLVRLAAPHPGAIESRPWVEFVKDGHVLGSAPVSVRPEPAGPGISSGRAGVRVVSADAVVSLSIRQRGAWYLIELPVAPSRSTQPRRRGRPTGPCVRPRLTAPPYRD